MFSVTDMASAAWGRCRSCTQLMPPGVLLLVLSAFFFSMGGACVKLAGQRLPFMEILWVRSFVSVVASIATLRHTKASILGVNRPLLLLRGCFGLGAMALVFRSMVVLPLAEATVVFFTNPVWVALLSAVFLREAVSWRLAGALVLSLLGVVLVAKPAPLFAAANSLNPHDVHLCLVGAFCAAMAMVTLRRLMRTENPHTPIVYLSGVSLLGASVVAFPIWLPPTPTEWLYLFGVGGSIHLGQVFMNKGYALLPAGRASAIGYLQIVFNGLWAYLLFSQAPDGFGWLGAVLVFGGFWLTSRGDVSRVRG